MKCLINLLQLETCNVMLKVVSDIMAHWFDLWNTIVIAMNLCNARKWCVHWCFSNNGIKCLSNLIQLQPCNIIFKVISDIMAHWNDMWNIILLTTNSCNVKKMISSMILIINNHNGIKCLNNLIMLVPCNVIFL